MIAASVTPARRGTAFGLASSAQAIAFMVGPMAAAAFTATSLPLGFAVCGVCFVGLAVMLAVLSRPPAQGRAQ
jgi:MFS family permease